MLFQIFGLIVIASFYLAYFVKMLGQKKKGIKTHQIGKGVKSAGALKVEHFMGFATVFIVVAEVASIALDWYCIELNAVRAIGVSLGAVGVAVFITAMVTMRDSWRAGINKEEKTTLVTRGIYKISRNPAFLGFDLVYIGLMLAFFNPVMLVFTVLAVLSLHMQILQEEKFLIDVFPDYMEYKKKVGRYFLFI